MVYGTIAGLASAGLASVLAASGMCRPGATDDSAARGMMEVLSAPLASREGTQFPERTGVAAVTKVATIRVEGMTCGGCVIGVRTALRRMQGVASAEVSYDDQRAVVTFDPQAVNTDALVEAIRKFGYRATLVEVKDKA